MFSTLMRMLNNEDQAKDSLQEAFIKAFQKIHTLAESEAFGGWLKQIVINTGLEYVRKRKIDFEDIEDVPEIAVEIDNTQSIENETIHEAIKSLPEGCRTIICLHLLEGFKHREIADKLGIAESTSKTQYRHAKLLLKKKLMHHYEN